MGLDYICLTTTRVPPGNIMCSIPGVLTVTLHTSRTRDQCLAAMVASSRGSSG